MDGLPFLSVTLADQEKEEKDEKVCFVSLHFRICGNLNISLCRFAKPKPHCKHGDQCESKVDGVSQYHQFL